MPENIVRQNDRLPRAIAQEKEGVVLYWVEESGVAGIHVRGLARLLGYDPGNLNKFVRAAYQSTLLEAEIVTEQGLRDVWLIPESNLSDILVEIVTSKMDREVRDRAKAILKKFTAAGFKLMVMMQLAPAELAARAVSHLDQELELERIRNEGKSIDRDTESIRERAQNFRHYVVTALPKPAADRILGVTEVKEIEYRDRVFKGSQLLSAGDTINKTEICRMFGLISKSGAPNYKELNRQLAQMNIPESAWEETETIQTNRELKRSYLPELDRALYTADQRQLWLGESA